MPDKTQRSLDDLRKKLAEILKMHGPQAAYNLISRTEVHSGLRKPTLSVYDHAFHFIGGAQKYGLTMAHALQDIFDITFIASKDVTLDDFKKWYDLDLSSCTIKIMKIPYFESKGTPHIDPALVPDNEDNPFDGISRESGNYDFFINNSMNEWICPLSNISAIVCHFPERRPRRFFYGRRYSRIIYNSLYTAAWIKKKWDIKPHDHLYPPVDMEGYDGKSPKQNWIISVARFETEGTKRQKEMAETFLKLSRKHSEAVKGWRLILAGGSTENNPYLTQIQDLLSINPSIPVDLKVNIPVYELRSLYKNAKIFWHMCGLNRTDPAEVEHFGMTTVEAMQNQVVPIVYNGGGLREIVDHEINGMRVDSSAQLIKRTLQLLHQPELTAKLAREARTRSRSFTREKFQERTKQLFKSLLNEYKTGFDTECLLPIH